MLDLLIKDGRIIDGTGNPWFKGDVGIQAGRIVLISHLIEQAADDVIAARNMVVCPGFIDMHSHSDLEALLAPMLEPKVMQGITSELVGQDGFSLAPLTEQNRNILSRQVPWYDDYSNSDFSWASLGEYLTELEKVRPAVNIAGLVGHGTVRMAVMGMANREATEQELEAMKDLLRQSMEQGAFGISTGLIYAPCYYADTRELIELCQIASQYGGILVVHMRSESTRLLEAIDEMLHISAVTGIPLHISHFKIFGRDSWGKSEQSLERLEKARHRGLDVTVDQYPYLAGNTPMIALLPPWVLDGGPDQFMSRILNPQLQERIKQELSTDTSWENQVKMVGWENIVVSFLKSSTNKHMIGKNIAEIARSQKENPADVIFRLLVEAELAATVIVHYGSEEDLYRIMAHPLQMVGTDGILVGRPHPRAYGTYPRILGHYVREQKLMPLEQAVRKMTSFPAQRLQFRDRGILREGAWADIVIFEPQSVTDKATYEEPTQYPIGINYVIVNGHVTVAEGRHQGTRAGIHIKKV